VLHPRRQIEGGDCRRSARIRVSNEYLKVGLGRNMPAMPSIVKNDPFGWIKYLRKSLATVTFFAPFGISPQALTAWLRDRFALIAERQAHRDDIVVFLFLVKDDQGPQVRGDDAPARQHRVDPSHVANTDRIRRDVNPGPNAMFQSAVVSSGAHSSSGREAVGDGEARPSAVSPAPAVQNLQGSTVVRAR
jgi:hypothetical protein